MALKIMRETLTTGACGPQREALGTLQSGRNPSLAGGTGAARSRGARVPRFVQLVLEDECRGADGVECVAGGVA